VNEEAILDGLASFKGLAHRMEYVGCYHGFHWVNDSIATIPEASIAAVQSLPDVDTLILGGFDRGISYESFADFLIHSQVHTLILVGDAGRRIGNEIEKRDKTIKSTKNLFYINRFDNLMPLVLEHTRPGTTCLLSPAASSYDEFRSFEERGFRFRELIVGK
jgi:UDP-N-acetylmuramoylalanine--D-glutamate ligase